jgi:Cu(I)/Ag(I) efflux system periplasmic protein CusF
MQRLLVVTLAFLSMLPLPALAQHDHAMAMPVAGGAPTAKADAMTDGVVKRIDRQAGSITIAHEPLVNLGMPRMTMTFRLKERSLIDGIKEGAQVRFVAENVNGALTVVALQAAK